MIVGRKSAHSLYRHELATYEEGDQYDTSAAHGLHQDPRPRPDHPGQAPAPQGQAGGPRLELPSIIPPDRAD